VTPAPALRAGRCETIASSRFSRADRCNFSHWWKNKKAAGRVLTGKPTTGPARPRRSLYAPECCHCEALARFAFFVRRQVQFLALMEEQESIGLKAGQCSSLCNRRKSFGNQSEGVGIRTRDLRIKSLLRGLFHTAQGLR